MIIGFTGTRSGMSGAQKLQLAMVLRELRSSEFTSAKGRNQFHYGAAKGADDEAANMAVLSGYESVPHYPAERTAAALLSRNTDIVSACAILIAAPLTNAEERRSGTWATVRYARKAGKPVVMLSR